jgi:RNA polymerase sigma-70 factor (ECF subfamily)
MSTHSHHSTARVPERNEPELVTRYLGGDERAFAELYRRFAPSLLRYARSRVRCPQLADDLVQQAFVNAHFARHRFDREAPLRPWLMRIVANLVRDHFRGERRRRAADFDIELVAAPETVSPLEERERAQLAHRALALLREPQRRVVQLHWLEERPFPELATELGVNVVTAKVRAHRAYKQMRSALAAV